MACPFSQDKFIDADEKTEIGLQFENNELPTFLYIGKTFQILNRSGKMPT